MADYRTLTNAAIETALRELTDWSLASGKLETAFVLASFRDALAFIVRVGFEAEELNHHPEIVNVYNRVSFKLSTHDAGDAITERDIVLATRISALVRVFLAAR